MNVGGGTVAAAALLALALAHAAPAATQQGKAMAMLAQDPACTTPKIAAAGGPMPRGANTVVLRWLGVSNYELSYRDQVILFDTFYSRVWPARPLGVMPEAFKRANAAFFGHGHWDHIADAPEIAKQTGARMYGGPPTTEWLKMQGVPDAQLVTWKGGESQKFNGFTVQAIRANHAGRAAGAGEQDDDVVRTARARVLRAAADRRGAGREPASAPAWRRWAAHQREGTLTYLITFDNGYRIVYADTAGSISAEQKAALAAVPRTDIGIVPYTGRFNTTLQNTESIPIVLTFKPRIVLPSHHEDETGIGAHYDMPIYPLGIAVRDTFPDAQTIDPLYLSGLCFDTESKEFFVGR